MEEQEDLCNAVLLPVRSKKRRTRSKNATLPAASRLSKSQQRKLRRLQEEKDKREKSAEVLETLLKHKLADNAYTLLHASATRGQRESMRDKLRRAMHFKRAGLEVPPDVPLFRERIMEDKCPLEGATQREFMDLAKECTKRHKVETDVSLLNVPFCDQLSGESKEGLGLEQLGSSEGGKEEEFSINTKKWNSDVDGATQKDRELEKRRAKKMKTTEEQPSGAAHANATNFAIEELPYDCSIGMPQTSNKLGKKSRLQDFDNKRKRGLNQEERLAAKRKDNKSCETKLDVQSDDLKAEGIADVEAGKFRRCSSEAKESCEMVRARSPKFVVHVSRLQEVEKARKKLPIIMMEQEIMEAINENLVTIICGETGCGKTTQVPQFLYEAAFSSSNCPDRSGAIGVTQPRRVAVLATAKRVSHELNVRLGQEVGFQVRHDRSIGKNTCIKFMTDGILLREVQSDFLLRKYSVIILDEAHERSLNTDILIGMLSRILRLRQTLYEEQGSSQEAHVFPLKLVIMSATLSIDDFVSERDMFASPPPIVQVPTRQFPVTVHFSAKTELLDYVGKAYMKVCSIHKKLPPGGILVFLTGQAEVNYLCRRLRKAFPKHEEKRDFFYNLTSDMEKNDDEMEVSTGVKLKDIFDAVDVDYTSEQEQYDAVEISDGQGLSDASIESSSETESVTDVANLASTEAKNKWEPQGCNSLDAIKAAFDAFTGVEKEDFSHVEKQNFEKGVLFKNPGPLHVLPLYAMLPAASQFKVFGDVPEGSRLVVVATNVAETSITIPGIRYVVDCGRAKEKVYLRDSGITRFEVRWISKSSAAQRAGRAGRTGPGHCYRLYSSAIFNDTFPGTSQPEIDRVPIEGVVLLLKSLGIVKVNNFPFPSPPSERALIEAEQCLVALSALDRSSGLLTPLGRMLSVYPIGPRHSCLLLTAMRVGSSENIAERSLVLAYAAGAAAALSLDNPFVTQMDTKNESGALDKSKLRKNFLAHAQFMHPFSDVLSIILALRAYESSSCQEEFCNLNHLHSSVMHEMSKLRKQLIRMYLAFSKDECFEGGAPACADTVEATWKIAENQGLSMKQERVLRQAICAGWANRVARKVSLEEIRKGKDQGEHRKGKAIHYQACTASEKVFLHPSSSLRKMAPEFVVYNELVSTSRPYMKLVTAVDAQWLVMHANGLCTFSKPLAYPPPFYDAFPDDVFCWVSPSFGPYLWELPIQQRPLSRTKQRTAVFACSLLQGKVLPSIATLRPYLAADPSVVLTPGGLTQKRVSEMLHALGVGCVWNRRKLKAAWDAQPDFLLQELLLWVQKSSHGEVRNLWPCLKQEVELSGRELFGKQEGMRKPK